MRYTGLDAVLDRAYSVAVKTAQRYYLTAEVRQQLASDGLLDDMRQAIAEAALLASSHAKIGSPEFMREVSRVIYRFLRDYGYVVERGKRYFHRREVSESELVRESRAYNDVTPLDFEALRA